MRYTMSPLDEASIVIQFGEQIDSNIHKNIKMLASQLEHHPFPGMIEYIPAYTTLTIFYDPIQVLSASNPTQPLETSPYHLVQTWIEQMIAAQTDVSDEPSRTVHVPVCYGGTFGPDLKMVAEHHKLTENEVIDIHANQDYLVYMMGFAPGFPYIGGMSERIATPRRDSPRLAIPAGSVGIAGKQTGVYPIETPGGWQLIGQTPLRLFRPDNEPPTLFKQGDTIRFYPISEEQFEQWEGQKT